MGDTRRLRLRGMLLGAVLAAGPAVHCAQGEEISRFDPDAGEAPLEAGPAPGAFGDAGLAPPDTVECSEDTKQIYVVATDKALYRFYPDTLKFVRIGTIACPSVAGTFSMAIDRRGTAWVEYTDGRLFAVDTSNATCKPTAFRPGQTGFTTFGMGYVKNGGNAGSGDGSSGGAGSGDGGSGGAGTGDAGSGETLYVAGAGLASLDTKTFDLTFLGSLSFGRTELTGLDNELYAFSVGSGVIANLDKTTGATKSTYRTSATDSQAAFAFAQWGGDFWLFTGSVRSQVTQYSPSSDTSKVVVADTGMLIVGAGSSTCAPTSRPK